MKGVTLTSLPSSFLVCVVVEGGRKRQQAVGGFFGNVHPPPFLAGSWVLLMRAIKRVASPSSPPTLSFEICVLLVKQPVN